MSTQVRPTPSVMTVRDDGRGIPSQLQRKSGLAHMRTRARLISAELDILQERGCTLRVVLKGRP